MDRWIVLLGGNPLNAGLLTVASRRDARLLVVDWNEQPAVLGDRHVRLDIKETDSVLDAVRSLSGEFDFAYTSADVGTETVAQLHADRGLARPSSSALDAARHHRAHPSHTRRLAEARGLGDRAGEVAVSRGAMTSRFFEPLVQALPHRGLELVALDGGHLGLLLGRLHEVEAEVLDADGDGVAERDGQAAAGDLDDVGAGRDLRAVAAGAERLRRGGGLGHGGGGQLICGVVAQAVDIWCLGVGLLGPGRDQPDVPYSAKLPALTDIIDGSDLPSPGGASRRGCSGPADRAVRWGYFTITQSGRSNG